MCCGGVKDFVGMLHCPAVWSSLQVNVMLQPDGVWGCVCLKVWVHSKCSRLNADIWATVNQIVSKQWEADHHESDFTYEDEKISQVLIVYGSSSHM